MSKKRVLIVEDSEDYQAGYLIFKEIPNVEIKFVNTIDKFYSLWKQDKNFDLIFMDACMHSREFNTLALVQEIRKDNATVPIVAATSMGSASEIMMAAGCNYVFRKSTFRDFRNWKDKVKEILGI